MNTESIKLADLELVKRLQAGEKEAFTMIYAQYYLYVKYYCAKFVKNEKAAEDLTQDTFLKMLTRISSFNPNGQSVSFRGWLTRLAFNLSVNYFRRESKRRELELRALEEQNLGSSIEPRAEQILFQKEFEAAFWTDVKTLSEPMKQCFACHYVLGIKYADLCRVYGLWPHQVAFMISMGRQKLAKKLRSYV